MTISPYISDLLKPSSYPEKATSISLVQTHISNVFIGDTYVYKIKKPVNFGFLDFSTLEKRLYYCQQEVTLNNRFSKGVYLGVKPVTFNGKKYQIDGEGTIIDYAVKMKRLSDNELLKTKLKNKTLHLDDMVRVGKTIAQFHKNANQSEKISSYGRLEAIKLNTDENFEQTKEFIDICISKDGYHKLKKWTDNFYTYNDLLLKQRVKEGKIKDCHGDLHMEHICLTDPIILFDCIEFNERFRFIDVLSEIAFLLMDLEFHNGKKFAYQLLTSYFDYSDENNDEDIKKLIIFYKIYRAYVRGKVTCFMLNDKSITEEKKKKVIHTANKYFHLAQSYILDLIN